MLAGSLGGIPLVQHLLATQVFSSNYSSNHYSNYYRMPGRLETFHPGEASMREVMHIPAGENPTAVGLPGPYAARVEASALVAVGTLDDAGRPWTTVWGGARGLSAPIAPGVLGISTEVDARHDPPGDGQGKLVSALAIDLESRDRMKLAGLVVAGSAEMGGHGHGHHNDAGGDGDAEADGATAGSSLSAADGGPVRSPQEDDNDGAADLQAAVLITESIGNCPKYLNKRP
ncbi:hypothetical protein ACCO45_004027 [Purpureocillium lilacinum]|uniref:Uncharacterized protein n=1 Tax=Purpureocillium lilacinum TaxID=33203 RepID=A0ACC4E435_PURLI